MCPKQWRCIPKFLQLLHWSYQVLHLHFLFVKQLFQHSHSPCFTFWDVILLLQGVNIIQKFRGTHLAPNTQSTFVSAQQIGLHNKNSKLLLTILPPAWTHWSWEKMRIALHSIYIIPPVYCLFLDTLYVYCKLIIP